MTHRTLEEIKHILEGRSIQRIAHKHGYAHYSYEYKVSPGVPLTAYEFALWLERGYLPFGGRDFGRNKDGTEFWGIVHTD